jgi:hypothetical protein
LGNACYHPVQNLFSSCLISKNFKFKIYKIIILPAVLYGQSLTLREEHRLRVFENRVLRRIFVPKRRKWQEGREDFMLRNFVTCMPYQILLG